MCKTGTKKGISQQSKSKSNQPLLSQLCREERIMPINHKSTPRIRHTRTLTTGEQASTWTGLPLRTSDKRKPITPCKTPWPSHNTPEQDAARSTAGASRRTNSPASVFSSRCLERSLQRRAPDRVLHGSARATRDCFRLQSQARIPSKGSDFQDAQIHATGRAAN